MCVWILFDVVGRVVDWIRGSLGQCVRGYCLMWSEELRMRLSVVDTKMVIEGEEILEVVINGGDGSSLGQCVCGCC